MNSEPLAFALSHHRASTGTAPDSQLAATALLSGEACGETEAFILQHLDEADPAELADLVAARQSSFAALDRLARRFLEPGHPSREYLADQVAP